VLLLDFGVRITEVGITDSLLYMDYVAKIMETSISPEVQFKCHFLPPILRSQLCSGLFFS